LAAIWAHGLLNAFSGLFPLVVIAPNGSQTEFWIFASLGFMVGLITMILRSAKQSKFKSAAG